MDDPDLPREEHERALRGLKRLNQVSGVTSAMYRPIRRACIDRNNRRCGKPVRLLDVASGSGDLPIQWARLAKRDGLELEVTTIDISNTAIECQQTAAEKAGVKLDAIQMDCLTGRLPEGFDIVTCSLFMHHLERHQVFCLLQSMQQACDGTLLVCDLNRSRFNLALTQIAAQLVTRSYVVHKDAATSVRAAFTMEEFGELAERALARPIKIRRSFPCRFLMRVDEVTVPQEAAERSVAFA